MKVWKPKSAYAATRDGDWADLEAEVADLQSEEAARAFWADYVLTRARHYPEGWAIDVRNLCLSRVEDHRIAAKHAALDQAYRATMGDVR